MRSNLDSNLALAKQNLAYWQARLKPWYKFAWSHNTTIRQKIGKWKETIATLERLKKNERTYDGRYVA